MDAPTASELEVHPVVQAALAAAWADSFADDPNLRHEEGGWIYKNPTTAELIVRRASPGGQDYIRLDHPPSVTGFFIVGTYHTHPNPTAEGWNPEPSLNDRSAATRHGVPSLVMSDMGVHSCGPASRVGGLNGSTGFPK